MQHCIKTYCPERGEECTDRRCTNEQRAFCKSDREGPTEKERQTQRCAWHNQRIITRLDRKTREIIRDVDLKKSKCIWTRCYKAIIRQDKTHQNSERNCLVIGAASPSFFSSEVTVRPQPLGQKPSYLLITAVYLPFSSRILIKLDIFP